MRDDRLKKDRTIVADNAAELSSPGGDRVGALGGQGGELVAFDVTLEGIGLTGRWARLSPRRGKVWWTHNVEDETDGCGADETKVVDALRRTVPVNADIIRRAELVRVNGPGPLSTLGRTSLMAASGMTQTHDRSK